MNLSILIPYRSDGGVRAELLRIVHHRACLLCRTLKQKEDIRYCDDGAQAGIFNRGLAINGAALYSKADLFLIMDADTTYSELFMGDGLAQALLASAVDRKWRLPEIYRQLDHGMTDEIRCGAWITPQSDRVEWAGKSWSGLVIIPREAFELVRGGEERYNGHGADDVALGLALDTLYGEHERYAGEAVHLWHPRGAEENAAHNPELTRRYEAAAGNPEAMWEIIKEKPRWP